MIKNLVLTTVAVLGLCASSASAATFLFTPSTGADNTQLLGPSAIDPNGNQLGFDGETIDVINGVDKGVNPVDNGLGLVGVTKPVKVTYEFLGSRASNTNIALFLGSPTSFINNPSIVRTATGAKAYQTVHADGLLNFAFGTVSPASRVILINNNGVSTPAVAGAAMGFLADASDVNSYYVFFDDIAQPNRDFDDMALRISIAEVPLPAGGLLLISGLALAAGMRARKKSA